MLPLLLAGLIAAPPAAHFDLKSRLRAGLVAGEPLSLTVATDLSEGLVLHVDVGLSFSERTSGVMAIDVVYRSESLIGPLGESLWLMPFFGLGVRGSLGEDEWPDRFGFRVPIGLSLLGRTEPIELFAQLAVGMSIFPERRGTIDAGAGVRVGF